MTPISDPPLVELDGLERAFAMAFHEAARIRGIASKPSLTIPDEESVPARSETPEARRR